MIGGLLFSYVASPHFDAHVKEFRLLADVLNDIGLTLDMALPLLMSYELPWLGSPYLVLTSCSTLCKVACGICAGELCIIYITEKITSDMLTQP